MSALARIKTNRLEEWIERYVTKPEIWSEEVSEVETSSQS